MELDSSGRTLGSLLPPFFLSRSGRVGMVAGNFFNVLGVQPHLGRLLTPDDDRTRLGHPVAVLQYDFWQKRFAGARGIVGSTIRLNGSPFAVIGVSAPGFEGTDVGLQTQVWTPVPGVEAREGNNPYLKLNNLSPTLLKAQPARVRSRIKQEGPTSIRQDFAKETCAFFVQ